MTAAGRGLRLGGMVLRWWRRRRRRKLTAQPAPEAWGDWLAEGVGQWAHLGREERRRLLDRVQVLTAEKRWEAAQGFALTERMRVIIAGSAGLLLLGFDEPDYFPGVRTIIVHPAGYTRWSADRAGRHTVLEREVTALAEAHYRGPILLSWRDVERGAANAADGRNVVLHEFAHALDMKDGVVDGTPPLPDQPTLRRWVEVMGAAYERLQEDAEGGRRSLLDHYGASNVGEFFAVATEAFFEKPRQLRKRHEEVYRLMERYYRQDPAARVGR